MKNESRKTDTVPWMVSIPRASEMSGIPYGHLRKLVLEGELPFYKAGNRYYISVEDLKEVLRTHK